jgi:hypothetical protein
LITKDLLDINIKTNNNWNFISILCIKNNYEILEAIFKINSLKIDKYNIETNKNIIIKRESYNCLLLLIRYKYFNNEDIKSILKTITDYNYQILIIDLVYELDDTIDKYDYYILLTEPNLFYYLKTITNIDINKLLERLIKHRQLTLKLFTNNNK